MSEAAAASQPETNFVPIPQPDGDPRDIGFPVIDVDTREVGALKQDEADLDPRLVRWGYNPGMRGIHLPTNRTGLQHTMIPVAEFFAHRTFETPQENFTIDEYKPKEYPITILAQESERVVREVLEKAGYQAVLFNCTDQALVRVVNRTLIPALSEIRELFGDSAPIGRTCPAEDEMDYGVPREHCATCHLRWIVSANCKAYMEAISEDGMPVRVSDGHSITETRVYPDIQMLEATRASVEKGLKLYIREASAQWGETVSDIDNKKRDKINPEEHFLRKDVHAVAPSKKELAMIQEMAQAVTGMQGPREPAPQDNSLATAVLELAKSQAETNRINTETLEQNRVMMQKFFERDDQGADRAPAEDAQKNKGGTKK